MSAPSAPSRFVHIPDSSALLLNSGTYSEVPIYYRQDDKALHARVGQKYIRLYAHGDTSAKNLSWKDINLSKSKYSLDSFVLRWTGPAIAVAAE
jgi:hypothetical protein